jgi:hypothetical protein
MISVSCYNIYIIYKGMTDNSGIRRRRIRRHNATGVCEDL